MGIYVQTMYTTGRGIFVPIVLKFFKEGVGLLVTFQGSVTGLCEVDVTGDKKQAGKGLNAASNWNQHEVLNNLTGSANGNLAYPCSGVCLNVLSISGAVAPGFSSTPQGITLSVVQVD